jgi:hypothetical protein
MMLTSLISYQVSCRLIILAAQIVVSRTVLYGGVILKATPFAMLVVSSFPPLKLIIHFALLSHHFWGDGGLGCTRVSQTRQAISFPSSLYSTFMEGGCTSCHFFLVSCITMTLSRVSKSWLIPNMDQLLAMPDPCSFVSKTITLV